MCWVENPNHWLNNKSMQRQHKKYLRSEKFKEDERKRTEESLRISEQRIKEGWTGDI